jgi:hypothetical protein
MPRALRIEYPGAIYHVMNRGDAAGDDGGKGTAIVAGGTGKTGLDGGRVGGPHEG